VLNTNHENPYYAVLFSLLLLPLVWACDP